MVDPPRTLRADAERNRQAIIHAAEKVFAELGTDVTLEHVAEIAEVGIGTIYRRFGSVEDLVRVVLEGKMRRYADRGEHDAERAKTEPWEALRDYVMFVLEQQAADLAFSDVIVSPEGMSELFHEHSQQALHAWKTLIRRARQAGVVRHDLHHSDLYLLIHANHGIVQGTRHVAPQGWRRFAEFILDAYRNPGPHVTTPPADSRTPSECP